MEELRVNLATEVGALLRVGKGGHLLSKLTTVVAIIPPTTSSIERAFSIARGYVNRLTSRLSARNIELTSFGAHDLKGLNVSSLGDVESSIFAELYPNEVVDGPSVLG